LFTKLTVNILLLYAIKDSDKYKKSLLYVGSTVGSKNMSSNQFYSLGWNKLILHHKNGGGGKI